MKKHVCIIEVPLILYHTTVFVASGVKETNLDFDKGIMSVDKV